MRMSPVSRELVTILGKELARLVSACSAAPSSSSGLSVPPPCGGTSLDTDGFLYMGRVMFLFLWQEILARHYCGFDAFILFTDKARRFATTRFERRAVARITCAKVPFSHGIKRLKPCMMARKARTNPPQIGRESRFSSGHPEAAVPCWHRYFRMQSFAGRPRLARARFPKLNASALFRCALAMLALGAADPSRADLTSLFGAVDPFKTESKVAPTPSTIWEPAKPLPTV